MRQRRRRSRFFIDVLLGLSLYFPHVLPRANAKEKKTRAPSGCFIPYEITDIQWDLTSYLKTEDAVETVPEDVEAFITLSKDGKLNGNTGVNILNTTYSLSDGNGIQIQPGATTMMAAPTEEIGNFEQRFLELLGSAVSYRLSGDTLTLVDANDSSLLIFSCKK